LAAANGINPSYESLDFEERLGAEIFVIGDRTGRRAVLDRFPDQA
jgi:hypothetical protein